MTPQEEAEYRRQRRTQGVAPMGGSALHSGYGYRSGGYGWPSPYGLGMAYGPYNPLAPGMADSDGDGIPDRQDPTPYGGGGAGMSMLSGSQFGSGAGGEAGGMGDGGGAGDGGGGGGD